MNISIDAMGGDNAPLEIIKGAYDAAVKYPNINFTLVGDSETVSKHLSNFVKLNNIFIQHAESTIEMDDDPLLITKEKSNSSMAVGLKLLSEGKVDAFLSAGSTGALHVGSSLIVRRIKGIRRSAIATVIPFEKPIFLLDAGANTDITPEIVNQWAILGSVYMRNMLGMEKVRVGLLNNGTEENKGTQVMQESFRLLKQNEKIDFVGNIESRCLSSSPCDLLLTDGFTGNILLKSIEGMGKFLLGQLKSIFTKNLLNKLSYLVVKNDISVLKNAFDASTYGGAPLLGLKKPVIKAHGNSKANDIVSAVEQAIKFVESGIIDKVSEQIN